MSELKDRKVVIVGLARQGKAFARFAVARGANVLVTDQRPADALAAEMAELAPMGVKGHFGGHPDCLLDGADLLIVSGGVPADSEIVAEAKRRGIRISNDSQEFATRTTARLIGVTGSAGKSTTCALIGAVGRAAGVNTWVGGNIGRPLIAEMDDIESGDLVVQELSSFQLEHWQSSPEIAAVLNITPNHLDRHRSMAEYIDAKANILRFQSVGSQAVLSADDPQASGLSSMTSGRLRLFSAEGPVDDGAFLRDGWIILRDGQSESEIMPATDLRLRGRHNVINGLAAAALADCAGLPVDAIAAGMSQFTGVEHRLEVAGTIDGVTYINDSIATAPERAIAAILAFEEPLILLAGGRDKNMNWTEWSRLICQRVDRVVLFGELAGQLERLISQEARIVGRAPAISMVSGVEAAIETATSLANSGDVVLFSPGGTSFDEFFDFAERGRFMMKLVSSLVDDTEESR